MGDADISSFRVLKFSVDSEYSPLRDFDCCVLGIMCGDMEFSGDELTILSEFSVFYNSFDPDVVVLEEGDRFAVEYLLFRFRFVGLEFMFGREVQSFRGVGGRSYFSYSSVLRRNPPHYFRGRYHFDGCGFMFRECGVDGIFELSRLSSLPPQMVARLSPGRVITNLYVSTAFRLGYPVPYKMNMVEDFKSARVLLDADKGGFVYEPVSGFHTGVCELDFASLYPYIMVNFNISPETVLCKCCVGKNSVPYAGYHICERRVGLVPQVLKPLIIRRMELKRLFVESGDIRFKCMSNALKWVLVTSFGYMGFRKSRFARIEGHECITSYARHILLESTDIAEDLGFNVLHGIVDSLWVQKDGISELDVAHLCEIVFRRFNIPFEVEGFYKWIVFMPSVASGIAPVPNRYYGVFNSGKIKVRGIELRRRDAPPLIKNFQTEVLEVLASSDSVEDFRSRFGDCLKLFRRYCKKLFSNDFVRSDLAVRKRVSRGVEMYKGVTAESIVLRHLIAEGVTVYPGETVEYVIRDVKAKNPMLRYVPLSQKLDGRVDVHKYIWLLAGALESLLCGFGFSRKSIIDFLSGGMQTRLIDFQSSQ